MYLALPQNIRNSRLNELDHPKFLKKNTLHKFLSLQSAGFFPSNEQSKERFEKKMFSSVGYPEMKTTSSQTLSIKTTRLLKCEAVFL